jgi:acetyl esterase/lipase
MMADRVVIEENVVFARVREQGRERELSCEIFRPPSDAANGAGIVLLHGGAWQRGDRNQLRAYGIHLGREGFVCMASSYRLTPEATWPAQMDDVHAALRYMRENARALGVDPNRIAAIGASAGGHLALLAAAGAFASEPQASRPLRAVVAIFPPTLLSPRDAMEEGAVPALALLGDNDTAEASAAASPINYVRPGFPPTLLLHGNADELVPAKASMRMYEALLAARVPAELHMVADQPHAYVLQRDFHRLSVQIIALFLRRYLGLRPDVTLPSTVTGAARAS